MAEFPAPAAGIVLTRYIVASAARPSRRFSAGVPGGELLREREPWELGIERAFISITPPRGSLPREVMRTGGRGSRVRRGYGARAVPGRGARDTGAGWLVADPRVADLVTLARSLAADHAAALAECVSIAPDPAGQPGAAPGALP